MIDVFFFDQPGGSDRRPKFGAEFAVLVAVGAAEVVKFDVEPSKVGLMRLAHLGDDFRFGSAFLLASNHDGRAVRVVGADVDAPVASQLLKAHPDVGLDVLDQVADVDMSIRVGQRGCDEDLPLCHLSGPFVCRTGSVSDLGTLGNVWLQGD